MRYGVIGAAFLALAACSKAPDAVSVEKLATYDVEPSAAAPVKSASAANSPQPIAVAIPQMAYSYKYAFRLAGDAIAGAQQTHIALCDRLGPARCQVLALDSGKSDDMASTGTLKLRVQSSIARRFGQQLQDSIAKAGGRALSSSIAAEDVSKDIVDTEARLRQRTLLVERLTDILRTRTGKVSELVEAERSVAAAQEEIDQAKGWLGELRGRVVMSTIEIGYQAVAADPGSPRSGLAEAVVGSWSTFTMGIAAILRTLIFLAPWALMAGLSVLGWRGLGFRLRRTRDAQP